MKFVILVVFLVFFTTGNAELCEKDYVGDHMTTLSDDQREWAKTICESCMVEVGVTFEQLKTVEETKPKHPPLEVQCYYKCYGIKFGTMDSKGNFKQEVINEIVNSTSLDAGLSCLPDSQEKDKEDEAFLCHRSYTVYHCFIEIMSKFQKDN